MKAVARIEKLENFFGPFMTREWIFESCNLESMPGLLKQHGELAEAYGALCLCDLDWDYYVQLYCYGLRRFILKEQGAMRPTQQGELERVTAIHNSMSLPRERARGGGTPPSGTCVTSSWTGERTASKSSEYLAERIL